MQNIDYNYLCGVIGNLSGIPVRVFYKETRIFYHSIADLPFDPLEAFRSEVLSVNSHIGYYITPYFHYYGIVNSGKHKIVLGPSIQTKNSDQILKELAFRCGVAAADTDAFLSGMKSITPMPLESILQILCTMNYVLNGEKLGLSDIQIYESEQNDLRERAEKVRASEGFGDETGNGEFQQSVHNTLAPEQTIMNMVRRGDTAALKEWTANAPAVRPGIMASDQLRQMKNTFIVTATLVSRAAIRGGMDVEDALSLSDAYIRECELLGGIDKITNLQYRMVTDYTERIDKLRMGKTPSKLVLDVTNYVLHHLSDQITTEKIAKALFISRSRLSVKFKTETGENLIDFILREKTEEAKRLLRYTDKPAVAISNFLAFSSQSHFSRVFRKYAGLLPNEYRKLYS